MHFFAKLLPLVLLSAAVASAQDRLVESSATLALTLTYSGEITTRALRDGGALHTSTLGSHRLGNREILEAMVAEGLIDSIRGWRVVGLWAEWDTAEPYAGNAYRFFARRGSGASLEHVAVPASILSIEPFVGAIGIRHTRDAADTLVAGTETFTLFEEVTFDLAGHDGLLHAHTTGGGRYVKLKGETEARYFIPSASQSTLVGTYTDDGEIAAGVASGTLKFSTAKIITPHASSDSSSGVSVSAISPGPASEPVDVSIGVFVN